MIRIPTNLRHKDGMVSIDQFFVFGFFFCFFFRFAFFFVVSCVYQAFCQPTEGTATNLLAFSPVEDDDGVEEVAEESVVPSELLPPPPLPPSLLSRVDADPSADSALAAVDPILLLAESFVESAPLEGDDVPGPPPSEIEDELVLASSRCWADPPPPPLLGG